MKTNANVQKKHKIFRAARNNNAFYWLLVAVVSFIVTAWTLSGTDKPVIYIIGDSTVKCGTITGEGGLWGWGNFVPKHFDTTKIKIENHAIGGRSSRTFQTEGRWNKILATLKPGDFVLMQFGHNDEGAISDTSRSRGSLKGISDESYEIYNPILKKQEIVYSYGWYMRKYITDTKAKGATPIICSPVPRNIWIDGKVKRDSATYTLWASQIARNEGTPFVNLNEIIANQYDKLGSESVSTSLFTPKDHTHTSKAGAELNAASVIEGIKMLKDCPLKGYLIDAH